MSTKKPTMKQVKNVINNMLIHMSNMQGQINKLESITASYITYNKDDKKFNKWLEKKLKEVKQNDNKSEDPGKSKDRDKKSKRKAG